MLAKCEHTCNEMHMPKVSNMILDALGTLCDIACEIVRNKHILIEQSVTLTEQSYNYLHVTGS